MSEKQNSLECNAVCWIIAAIVGFVSMFMLYLLADFSFLQSFFTGGLVGLLLGVLLSVFICRDQKAAADLSAEEKPAQRYAREAEEDRARREGENAQRSAAMGGAAAAASGSSAASEASSHTATESPADEVAAAVEEKASPAQASEGDTSAADASDAAAAAGSTTASSFVSSPVSASKELPGEAELASRKGTWKYEADGGDAATPASSDADASSAGADASGGDDAATTPLEDVAEEAPQLFTSPPDEGADDLKLISGVGPKLEQTLNELGIYRFAQVAEWGRSEIAWVDNRLRFKGRIERDDWISQAKILAEGGETEFSKRNK